MHNAVMCTLSLYDVIGTTRHLHIKLKSFSNIGQPLHKDAVRSCSFSFNSAKKSVIMSEAFLVDVSIYWQSKIFNNQREREREREIDHYTFDGNQQYSFFWFGLILYVLVNSYGHVGTVSSSNHTFFLGKFNTTLCRTLACS